MTDKEQAVTVREWLFRSAAEGKVLVAGMHLPFPGIGPIRAEGNKAYTWVPVEYSPIRGNIVVTRYGLAIIHVDRKNENSRTCAPVDRSFLAGDRILSACASPSVHAASFKTLARGYNSLCRFPDRFDPGLYSRGGASRRPGHPAPADLDGCQADPENGDCGVPTCKRELGGG